MCYGSDDAQARWQQASALGQWHKVCLCINEWYSEKTVETCFCSTHECSRCDLIALQVWNQEHVVDEDQQSWVQHKLADALMVWMVSNVEVEQALLRLIDCR